MHSVIVLFVIPGVFIVIMSLALQDQFSEGKEATFKIYYSNPEPNEYSDKLLSYLSGNKYFTFERSKQTAEPGSIIKTLGDRSKAFIEIPTDLSSYTITSPEVTNPIRIWLSPSINIQSSQLLEIAVSEALVKTRLHFIFSEQASSGISIEELLPENSIQVGFLYTSEEDPVKTPTAVQQNVPAWLIFSMFFVVIPISTTLITEKQQGTLTRLNSMNVSMGLFLAAKSLPYLVINQVQLILMLLVGAYVVPLLGGDTLIIGNNYFALTLLSLAVGISAIGYAMLIAVIAKTTEQATTFGGIGIILLGAIGGIMVPKFIMPENLQELAMISPMSWGLDGFLDILLYNKSTIAIIPEVTILMTFGGLLFTSALIISRKNT
ncbi:MAG: ABC transporter permease [Xanthomonadales bacterium]|nr:ABC transporter permease [Xanthomonadales bacterium]